MRKVITCTLLALGMALVSNFAYAVPTVASMDGMIGVGEWDTYFIHGTDPQESNINDNYNIWQVFSWWDTTTAYIRTDVYGTPTLAKLNPNSNSPASYQWSIDTTGDAGVDGAGNATGVDMFVVLELANQDLGGNDRLRLEAADRTFWAYGPAVLNNVVEGSFNIASIPAALRPSGPVSMFLDLENAGNDPDDRLPNTGWATTIPEPSSMLLLGIGLFGFAGGLIRKRFKA